MNAKDLLHLLIKKLLSTLDLLKMAFLRFMLERSLFQNSTNNSGSLKSVDHAVSTLERARSEQSLPVEDRV